MKVFLLVNYIIISISIVQSLIFAPLGCIDFLNSDLLTMI